MKQYHLCLEAYDRIAAGPDYETLNPAEARARSRESVLHRPVQVAVLAKPVAKTPTAPLKKPPEPAQAIPAQAAPAPSDYGMYRCRACGKRVLGFDREEHTRQVHGGKEPGYGNI